MHGSVPGEIRLCDALLLDELMAAAGRERISVGREVGGAAACQRACVVADEGKEDDVGVEVAERGREAATREKRILC